MAGWPCRHPPRPRRRCRSGRLERQHHCCAPFIRRLPLLDLIRPSSLQKAQSSSSATFLMSSKGISPLSSQGISLLWVLGVTTVIPRPRRCVELHSASTGWGRSWRPPYQGRPLRPLPSSFLLGRCGSRLVDWYTRVVFLFT